MYYQPCLASLYGKNIGMSSDVEVAYFMAYPWHTHEECTKLTCLSDSMRWNRGEGGCEAGLLSRSADTNYGDGQDSFCTYDLDGSADPQECKYTTTVLKKYEEETERCWGDDDTGMLGSRRIDDIMNDFCMPVITTKKITGAEQTALATAIATCSNRQTVPAGRRLKKSNLKSKLGNLKKKDSGLKDVEASAAGGETKESDNVEMRRNTKSDIGNIEAEVVDIESEVDSMTVE
jgi:hypothetical protein